MKTKTSPSSKKNSRNSTKALVLSSKLAYKGPAFWVTTDQVEEPSGIRARRDVVRHSGSVVILAVDGTRTNRGCCLKDNIGMQLADIFLSCLPDGSMKARQS